MDQNPSIGRHFGGAARKLAFAASFVLAPAAYGPMAATAPPTETTQAVVNCANAGGPIATNPGPGTRGAVCEGFHDYGTNGIASNYASAGSHQFSSGQPFVNVSAGADSFPYPDTGAMPSVSVSAATAMSSAHKARARNPGASAPTVRLRVAIAIFGNYTSASGQTAGRVRGGFNGPFNALFDWNHITIPTFGVVEYVDLAPEEFGEPTTGDFLHLRLEASCADGASVFTPSALCTADTSVVVTIDPTDPNAADYEVASGPNPSEMTIRWADPTTLVWDPVPDAVGYDIVRGDLTNLRASGGDFSFATDACEASMTLMTSIPFTPDPSAGAGFWFLGRPETSLGTGSWDSVCPGQTEPRDTEVAASGNDCP